MAIDKRATMESQIISKEMTKIRVVSSKELLGDAKSLTIQHEGEFYHLRATKFGKLVLTK
jgi:hemin uptake protein HemP